MGRYLRVHGTPEHVLATDRFDVNSWGGRYVLWWKAKIAVATQADLNRNTGKHWTHKELVDLANELNGELRNAD